jgi:hypothetical protein
MNEQARTAAKRVFHVGRLDDQGNAKFAFNLRRREGGGIGLSSIKESLTEHERAHLFSHFGAQVTSRTGGVRDGKTWESFETREPGTAEHFLAAVHALPDPFCLMSSED